MPFISDNWSQLTQKACWFELKSHEEEVFPLYCSKEMSRFLFRSKKDAKVFMPSKKLVLAMCIDGKTYEYGLPILDVCKVVINNLAFKSQ